MAIPLPGSGIEGFSQGFGGVNNVFKDMMQRAMERQKLREMAQEHMENLGERKRATDLSNNYNLAQLQMKKDLAPFQRMLLQAQIQKAQQEADPMFKINQAENLMKLFGGQQQGLQEGQSFIPSISGVPQMPPETKPGMDWDRLAKNPAAVAAYKSIGIDLSHINPTYAPSNTGKELQERADVEAGFYPNTNRSQRFESPDVQQEYSNIYSSKTTGLPKGNHYILGDSGERIGIERPTTAKERDVNKGSVLFNEFFPLVNNGLNYYSGEDSITKLENDARNYKTDPEARNRFDQFLIAEKLGTVTGVNEAARFGAGRTNQVFNRFVLLLVS